MTERSWKWNVEEMREMGSLADHVEHTLRSDDMVQLPSPPAIPSVQGFTPINQPLDSPVLANASSMTVQATIGANHGKKRQRKVSRQPSKPSKLAKSNHPRLSKKRKEDSVSNNQDISTAFNVTKPLSQGKTGFCKPEEDPSPGTFKENRITKLPLYDREDREMKGPPSPATFQAPLSPKATGLGSIYEAAFKQKRTQSPPNGPCGLLLLNELTYMETEGSHEISATELASPSVSKRTARPDIGESVQNTPKSPFKEFVVSSEAVADPVCQVPCSSAIMSDLLLAGDTDVESAAKMTTLPFLDPWLMQPGSRDLDQERPHLINDLENRDSRYGGTSPSRIHDRDSPDPDNLLHPAAEADRSTPDPDEADLSILMSEFTRYDDGVPGDYSEVVAAYVPDRPSPSQVDISKSFDDDNTITPLSDISFVPSSSPYLRSRSDLHTSSNQVDVSPTSPTSDHHVTNEEDIYNDNDLETGLIQLENLPSAQVPRSLLTTPTSSPLHPTALSTLNLLSPAPKSKSETSKFQDVPHKVSFDQRGAPVPFIRTPFPAPVHDRSLVNGLSSRTLLRTCFRIGEALNAGSLALRTRQDSVIELYARVIHSERPTGTVKQHFQFSDIFSPDKPPFLKGTYGLWKGVEIWDQDSKVFLGDKGKGKMARVVGRIGRDETTRDLVLTVLSIWEAGWDDVGFVKGIVGR
ncbi:MAG: hypothetical protein Q9170_006054 [Blastenia crenularia]